jgi:pyridoxine 4-dehydrogenase
MKMPIRLDTTSSPRTSDRRLPSARVDNDIAWVPYFPLGSSLPGFPKVTDNPVVRQIAGDLGVTPAQVGPAWLLAHAPTVLLIAGTHSIPHLKEDLRVGDITLSQKMIADLDEVPTDASAHSYGVEAFLDERR